MKLLKDHLLLVFATSITLVLFIINFKVGFLVLGNDNYSPEINPSVTVIKTILSPTWREYRALGVMSDTEQVDVFRSLVYLIFNSSGLPSWLISQLYIYISLFAALYSYGKLVGIWKPGKQNLMVLGSILYFFNLIGIWIFFSPTHQFFAAFCYFPFFVWRSIAYLDSKNSRNLALFAFSSLTLLPAALTATTILVLLVLWVCVLTLHAISSKQQNALTSLQRISKIIGVYTVLNLFWILPFIMYVSSNTDSLTQSLIYRKITPDIISSEASTNTLLNTIKSRFVWIDIKINSAYTYNYADFYINNPITTIWTLVLLGFGILGVVHAIRYKNRFVLGIFFIYLAGIYLIKGQQPPLEHLFVWAQNTFPIFFAQVFRWTSSKIWPLTTFTLPILVIFGVDSINYKVAKKVTILTLSILSLAYSFPMFNRYLIDNKSYVKIPNEYYQMASLINEVYPKERMYIAPESNTNYFKSYTWGFWGSVFQNYMFVNPIYEKALVIGSNKSEDAFYNIRGVYYSENGSKLVQTFQKYDISLVMIDRNVSNYIGYEIDWDLVNTQIENNPELEKVASYGNLSLFKVRPQSTSYRTSNLNIWKDLVPSDVSINESALTTSYSLPEDVSAVFSNALGPAAIYELPVSAQLSENMVMAIKPLFPTINGVRPNFEQTTELYYSQNIKPVYLSIGNQVLPLDSAYQVTNLGLRYKDVLDLRLARIPVLWVHNDIKGELLPNTKVFCDGNSESNSVKIYTEKGQCATEVIPINGTGIIETSITINSDKPVVISACITSDDLQVCTNKNTKNYLISKINEDQTINLHSPNIIFDGDTIQIFIDVFPTLTDSTVATETSIKNLSTKHITTSYKPYQVLSKGDDSSLLTNVPLMERKIDIEIPILQGNDSAFYDFSTGEALPDYSIDRYGVSSEVVNISSNSIHGGEKELSLIDHKTTSYLTLELLDFDLYKNVLLYISGKNIGGIPSDLRLTKLNSQIPLWEDKMGLNTESKLLRVDSLPNNDSNFKLTLKSPGHGLKPSTNTFSAILAQTIPNEWSDIELEVIGSNHGNIYKMFSPGQHLSNTFYLAESLFDNNLNSEDIVYIPTAESSYWSIRQTDMDLSSASVVKLYYAYLFNSKKVDVDVTQVDGWAQAWILNEDTDSSLIVIFTPNLIAYFGYITLAVSITTFSILAIRERLRLKKQADLI